MLKTRVLLPLFGKHYCHQQFRRDSPGYYQDSMLFQGSARRFNWGLGLVSCFHAWRYEEPLVSCACLFTLDNSQDDGSNQDAGINRLNTNPRNQRFKSGCPHQGIGDIGKEGFWAGTWHPVFWTCHSDVILGLSRHGVTWQSEKISGRKFFQE